MTKALLLAAGRGKRLQSLTDHTPKPLIEVNGKPLIVHHLEKLAAAGITDIVINISYLADKICQALGNGQQFGVKITYSFEPEALETGGGILQALPFLDENPFIVIAADLFTAYPFQELPTQLSGLAHLVLAPNPSFNPQGDFSLDEQNYISNTPAYTYASFGVIHPKLLEHSKSSKFSIVPLLRNAAENRLVTGEIYRGLWYNVGDMQQLTNLRDQLDSDHKTQAF